MFELVELTIGSFIIVKAGDFQDQKFPINVHAIVNVIEVDNGKYDALLIKGNASDELANSNELDVLRKKAIELTEEAIADEFSD